MNSRQTAAFDRAAGALGPDASREASGFFVPGRIEVLGKHTDYAGGRSLLCAVEQGFTVAVAPRADGVIRIINVDRADEMTCAWDQWLEPSIGQWTNYPMTVVRRVARNFASARLGADVAFVSDLPPSAGMSSSSAFMIAVFLALAEVNRLAVQPGYRSEIRGPEDLAAYLATIENGRSFGRLTGDRGVGTFGGSEDHTAILCCRADELAQYAFGPVRLERTVPFPSGHTLVVAASGVVAEKTGNVRDKYNRLSLAVQAILEHWRADSGRNDPTLEAAARSSPDAVDRIRGALARTTDSTFSSTELLDRFDQFRQESLELVPLAATALIAGDLAGFGTCVDRSQRCAEQLLGNQVAETAALQRLAREHGAVAASAFGAGFGGSVWAMVPESRVDTFRDGWRSAYLSAFPAHAAHAMFIVTHAGPGAMSVSRASDLLRA